MSRRRRFDSLVQQLRTAELEENLRLDGYTVRHGVSVGRSRFDLVATKGAEKIAYEIKTPSALKVATRQLDAYRKAAERAGFEFRLHVAVPPQEKVIEVDGLEDALRSFMSDDIPEPLEILSAGTTVDGVADVDVDSISVAAGAIRVEGTAVVDVTLQGGGSGEDAFAARDAFPFDFDAVLNEQLEIVEAEITVDTSSFYR